MSRRGFGTILSRSSTKSLSHLRDICTEVQGIKKTIKCDVIQNGACGVKSFN